MAKKYFVSRHSGAHLWASQRIPYDERCESLDPTTLQKGDIVFGTLPVSLAAEVIKQGAHYVHLTLDLPERLRGRELDSGQMESYQARLEEFHIERRPGMHDAIIKEADPATNAAAPLVMAIIHSAETLANLVPILNFKPSILVIFHTDEYKDKREWLKSAINHLVASRDILEKPIGTSYLANLSIMEETLKPCLGNGRLIANITGGMKPMSLALTEVSRRNGGEVIYFDVASNILDQIYPEKPAELLLEPSYAVDLWLRAHGHTLKETKLSKSEIDERINKARGLADLLRTIGVAEISPLHALIGKMKKYETQITFAEHVLHHKIRQELRDQGVLLGIGDSQELDFCDIEQRNFYGGNWLEYLVFAAMQNAGYVNALVGVVLNGPTGKRENELDVVAVEKNRPLIIEAKAQVATKGDKFSSWIDKLSAVATRAGGVMSIKIIVSLHLLDTQTHQEILKKSGIRVVHGNNVLDQKLLMKALQRSINGEQVVCIHPRR